MVDRMCKRCEKPFQSKSSAGARINYCSRWCQALAQQKKRSGCVRVMSVSEAAYIAGLVDGEGSVIVSDRRATRPGSSHPSVYLVVAGSYHPMHEWLIATTGVGRIYTQTKSESSRRLGGKKQMYNWRVHSELAVAIMKQILPYMVEKAARTERAILAFERGYEYYDSADSSAADPAIPAASASPSIP